MVPLILLLLTAAVVLLLLRLQRRQMQARPDATEERHLFNLRVGDIVQADGRDWMVEDRLLYEQSDGFQWLEYRLQDSAERRWLSVSEDDEVEVGWLVSTDPPRGDLAEQLQEGVPEVLPWRGQEYQLQERGTARLRTEVRSLNRGNGACSFADYQAPNGELLAVEWWGGRGAENIAIEISEGRRIDPASLTLLPGDGRSVYRPEALPQR